MFSLGKTKVATAETTTELAQLMASVAWAQALNDETISDSYEQIFTWSLLQKATKPTVYWRLKRDTSIDD